MSAGARSTPRSSAYLDALAQAIHKKLQRVRYLLYSHFLRNSLSLLILDVKKMELAVDRFDLAGSILLMPYWLPLALYRLKLNDI